MTNEKENHSLFLYSSRTGAACFQRMYGLDAKAYLEKSQEREDNSETQLSLFLSENFNKGEYE